MTNWREQARCAGVKDPDMFFKPAQQPIAALFCKACPVAVQCREFAGRAGVEDGMWGGVVFEPPEQVA